MPKALGGVDTIDNLAFACSGCNLSKGVRIEGVDAVTGVTVRLYHPRRDRWAAHFAWQKSSLEMIGFSPTGRVTIELLKLNRPNVINLRQILVVFGKHPPSPIDD